MIRLERPSPEMIAEIQRLCQLGHSQRRIAALMGVTRATVRWHCEKVQYKRRAGVVVRIGPSRRPFRRTERYPGAKPQ
jgi:DNA invertase Pin-like site-specific DNA recombinase